jgi:hypothetical protein
MRLVALRNTTGKQLVVSQLPGMVFKVDETKKVSPATLKHPAMSQYIGRGLELVTSPEKVEPKAPVPPIPVAPVSVAPAKEMVPAPTPIPEPVKAVEPESVPATVSTVEPSPSCEPDETVGTSLREIYLSAPGVTEENVDALLFRFPEIKDVPTAKKHELSDCGIHKADTAALKAWASNQIS